MPEDHDESDENARLTLGAAPDESVAKGAVASRRELALLTLACCACTLVTLGVGAALVLRHRPPLS